MTNQTAFKKGLTFLVLALLSFSSYSQSGATGIVSDEKSRPLGGVTVQAMRKDKPVKNTVTDSLGKFRFTDLLPGDYNFVFSHVSYQSQSVTGYNLKEGQTISMLVSMTSAASNLTDVVVVGFGTQKKQDVTGAISTVKMSEVLGNRPVINVGAALQGTVPGLLVTGNNQVGQSKSLQIRGAFTVGTANSDGSYGGAVAPLVLIDNVPGDINMLNPDDIESVSVLKDAASTAIYGARGAYGVVLVTTKKPKSGSRTTINYNNNFSSQHAINLPRQASLTDYFRMYQEAGYGATYWADGQNVSDWLGYLDQYKGDPSSLTIEGDGIYKATDDKAYYLRERDPYAQIVENSFMQSHNFSIAGASDKIRYRLSAGLTSQDGPMVLNKDKYNRYNISSYLSAEVTSWFTQEADIMLATSKRTLPGVETSGGLFTLRLLSYTPEGIIPADVYGLSADYPINTPLNTMKYAGLQTTNTATPRIFTKSIFKPFKGFEAVLEYTYNKSDVRYDYYTGQQPYTSIQKSVSVFPTVDVYTKDHNFINYNAINLYGNYTRSFGDHNFRVMAGFNKESSYYEDLWVQVKQQTSTTVPSMAGATGDKNPVDSYTEYGITGGFFRVNYSFRNKYLLEANGRYDGSSKFPAGNRYGFFPSVSVGWNINREAFLKDVHWINDLKLRASWGSIGNQNIDAYKYNPTMSVGPWTASATNWLNNGALVTTIGMPALVSSDFTWETVKSTNIGIDFALLKSRFSGSFDWYERNTIGMLAPGFQLPGVVGAEAPFQNTADMRVRGWELILNWRDKIGPVTYRVGVNLTDYNSVITNYNNNSKILGSGTQAYYTGQHLGEIWGYLADGYYTADDFVNTTNWQLKPEVTGIQGYTTILRPGDLKFKNLSDADGTSNLITPGGNTANDPGDRKVIGNTMPRYQYGANLGVSYRGFDLSAMIQGVGKRDYWLGNTAYFPFSGNDLFTPVFYNQLDYWKPKDPANGDYSAQNPSAQLPRIYNINGSSAPGSNTRVSDKYLTNVAYMRVKNVTLAYSLSGAWMHKAHLSAFRVFISVENLATFSNLPKGFDPETLNWTYPAYRTTSLGLSLTL